MSKPESNCSIEFVNVLRTERVNDANRIDLRVVKWERADCPVLEKRRIWESEEGDRDKKMVGLNASDLKYVYENYPEIINLL